MPSTYKINIDHTWFLFIQSGIKLIECRLNCDIYSHIFLNDIIEWYNNDIEYKGIKKYRSVKTKVTSIAYYTSFKDMFNYEPLNKVLPGIKTIDFGINKIYYDYYNQKAEKEYGVVAFRLELH